MTHKMTNDEIKEAYQKAGGPPIVHEPNPEGETVTVRELLFDVVLVISACAAAGVALWVVF